jgi:hypothetical protein
MPEPPGRPADPYVRHACGRVYTFRYDSPTKIVHMVLSLRACAQWPVGATKDDRLDHYFAILIFGLLQIL